MSSGSADSSTAPPEWASTEVRVRYAETDQMGMVYYSNYLVWFEVGRAEYCRQHGLVYRDLEHQAQIYLAVAEVQCRYHAPARYDDVLIIRTRVESFRKRLIIFQYEIVKRESEAVIADGKTVHVVLDKNGRPKTFPAEYAHYFVASRLGQS